MSYAHDEKYGDATNVQVEELRQRSIHDSNVLVNSDLMNDAFAGENAEHAQGTWQAVKEHPAACFWAFLFCFTIVRTSILRACEIRGR